MTSIINNVPAQEFKHLATQFNINGNSSKLMYVSASQPCNRYKNRYSNILPTEETRIKIQRKKKIVRKRKNVSGGISECLKDRKCSLYAQKRRSKILQEMCLKNNMMCIIDDEDEETDEEIYDDMDEEYVMEEEDEIYDSETLSTSSSDEFEEEEEEEEEGDDYINANLIKYGGLSYICCQAPLPITFNDFWLMVWQQNTPCIAMLNPEVENGKLKANAYWPEKDHQTLQFGDISVTLESTCILSPLDICIRYLTVQKKDETNARKLVHLQYLGWPDFGVPSSSVAIRDLIQMYHHFCGNGTGIVHCSAGVGRTGTFLAISLALHSPILNLVKNELKSKSFVTESEYHAGISALGIVDIVSSMRKQRNPGMVQTLDQYKFIYQALTDALQDQDLYPVNKPNSIITKFKANRPLSVSLDSISLFKVKQHC